MSSKDIKFLKMTHLKGPNIWTYRPVLEAWIDIGDLEDCPSNTLPGFNERLQEMLPGLVEHRCSVGERGGFLQRLAEGTWPGHIMEHVALELQNRAGMQTGFGKAREAGPRGIYKVVIRTRNETVSRVAIQAARDLVMAAIENRPYPVKEVIANLTQMVDRLCIGPSTACIVDAAAERNLPGKYVIPLLNTSGQPSLSVLENRALRQRIMETSLARGSSGGEFDNTIIVSRTALLRAQRAQILGYDNHAAYVLEDQTARTPTAVDQRLSAMITPAIRNARKEVADLQAMIQSEGVDFQLAAWDWAYYAAKVRAQRYAFDETQLRPYFEANNVLQKGVFFAANQIYGISFTERFDLPVYNPDVRVFDVTEADGSQLGIFLLADGWRIVISGLVRSFG